MVQHYHHSFLEEQRKLGDQPADGFIDGAFAAAAGKQLLYDWLAGIKSNNQLQHLPDSYALNNVFKSSTILPAWADIKQMQAGAAFFARYAQAIMNLLGLLSLPYCYAGANGAMVLYLSERIRNNTGKRLSETAGFVWDVMSPSAFTPDGKGFAACLKIRLTHAAARYYTLQSNRWNAAWGYPVNQEDMAGTNLSFSLIVIRGLRKMGYVITYEEQAAYLHLWNVIGCLLGLSEPLLPADGLQANHLEEAIRLHQFGPSEQGRALTHSLIQYFGSVSANSLFSMADISQLMRYLLGDDIATCLNIPAPSLSPQKLQLIKVTALLNELKPPASTHMLYTNGYKKFKKDVAAIQ